ncbi:MAG: cytochrome P450 [Cyanobacteria bacterium P01_A01_bin.40]
MTIVRLPYLGAICNETLRINPPAVSTFARTVKKPIEIDGYHLEPGTGIDVSIYLAHRRESVYPEPNEFKPERFLSGQFSPYEYLPFGGGQCRCLGASLAQYEMKLVLATIMSNFKLELIKPKLIKPKLHGIVMIPPELKMRVI